MLYKAYIVAVVICNFRESSVWIWEKQTLWYLLGCCGHLLATMQFIEWIFLR